MGRIEDIVMELAFTFTGAAHQNCFHPLTLGKGPLQDLCRRTSSFLARAPPALIVPSYTALGCLEVALPSLSLPGPTSPGKPAGWTCAGTTAGAREPQRASGTTRSCSSACCFGAARSQPAFDTS